MAYVYAQLYAVCVTIFGTGGKLQLVSNLKELHTLTQAARSYALLSTAWPCFDCIVFQLNTGQTSGPAHLDINVEPVWMQGYTGSGVVVGFVDDGTYAHCCVPT